MAESVNVANWPVSGSKERVAYELMRWLSGTVEVTGKEARKDAFLDLYVECLQATKGLRK
jgi:hypothetical protein